MPFGKRLAGFEKKDSIFYGTAIDKQLIRFPFAFVHPVEFNILTSNPSLQQQGDPLLCLTLAVFSHLTFKSSPSSPFTGCHSSEGWMDVDLLVFKVPDGTFPLKRVCLFPPVLQALTTK